ncbi:MAG: rRNA maturation RNase YbeY [Planctomycetaceae bacterium]
MYQIDIADRQDCLPIDQSHLRRVAESVLRDESVTNAQLSIALVDGPSMRELNRAYLDHDYDTDVLSFDLSDAVSAHIGENASQQTGRSIEGEIVISSEMAAQVAAGFDWSPQDEVVLYLVHGLLHLVGYDDSTVEQKAVMRTRERELLKGWNLSPRYSDPHPSAGDEVGGRA